MAKRTALYDIHKSSGGKLVDFAGFEMPIQYEGILKEHMAVRESVGMFDVSHMGEVEVRGADAFEFVQNLTTNDVSKLGEGKVQYSAMCLDEGGIVDDLLVYDFGDHFMLVINASNIEKDFRWMQENIKGDVQLINKSDDYSLLAVQGPNAEKTLQKLTDVDLSSIPYYNFKVGMIAGQEAIISHTGYTGEKVCFEIYSSSHKEKSESLWNAIMEAGAEFDIKPCGLGARDTLRLEYAFRLYGNDMDETTNPIEAGLGWITKLDVDNFNGKDAIVRCKSEGLKRRLMGFEVDGKVVARHGAEVFADGYKIGQVTSGGPSPILEKNIGLAYIDKGYDQPGQSIEIDVRGKRIPAVIVKTPFIQG